MALDNFRTQKIIWDRANKKIFETIEANSGDSNGRKLVVQVINQEVTEGLSGTTLSLGWKSRQGAKGLDVFDVVDASKGIFEIYYTTEMLSNIGNIEASFILIDSTGRIESSTFTISVRPSTVDDESVESENSFTALTEALVKVNDVTAQLAHKVGGSVKAQLEDLAPSVLSAIEGGEGTTFNLLSKPQPYSVTPETTTFMKFGKNLFNRLTIIRGHWIHPDTGVLTAASNFNTSDYIPVTPLTTYSRKQSNYIVYFDANKNVLTGGSSASGLSFTTPDQCYYIRISMTDSMINQEQVELGDVSTPYAEYEVSMDGVKLENVKLPENAVGMKEVKNQLFEVFKSGGNLIDNSLRSEVLVESLSRGNATLSTVDDEYSENLGMKAIRVDYPANMTSNGAVHTGALIPLLGVANVGDLLQAGVHIKVNKNTSPRRFSILIGFYNSLSATSWFSGIEKQVTVNDEWTHLAVSGPIPTGAKYMRLIIGNPVNNADTMQIDMLGLYLRKGTTKALLVQSDREQDGSNNPLQSKKIMFLGDSITQMDYGWVSVFNKIIKPLSFVNLASSGARWRDGADTTSYDGKPIAGLDPLNVLGNQVQKVLNQNYEAPDIIIIAAGTNDGAPETINLETQFTSSGGYVALNSVDRKTFAGSMRYVVETLLSKYPNAQIFISTPIQAAENSRGYAATKEKAEKIKAVAQRMSIPVFDAFNESGIYGAFESKDINGKYLDGGLHPNTELTGSGVVGSETGSEKLGKYFAKKIVTEYAKS